jgi:organic radical activating enzyme
MGRPSVFVRFSGCNLRCRWHDPRSKTDVLCDTFYASYQPERRLVDLEDLVRQVRSLLMPGDDIVVTGGEPLLFPRAVAVLYDVFGPSHHLTIETNGTRPMLLGPLQVLHSVSPKLSSSQSGTCLADVVRHVAASPSDVQLKFVIASPDDLAEVRECVAQVARPVTVFLMPLADTEAGLAASATWVAEAALQHGFCYSDRLHLRLWQGKRGT